MSPPTVSSLVAALAYVLTGLACLRARHAWKTFWTSIALVLFLLAVDRATGFHQLPATAARKLAQQYHVYENRHSLQREMLLAFVLGGVLACGSAYVLLRHRPIQQQAALIGLMLGLGYALVRITSYHPLDDVLETRIAGVRLLILFEYLPLIMIAAAAMVESTRLRKRD